MLAFKEKNKYMCKAVFYQCTDLREKRVQVSYVVPKLAGGLGPVAAFGSPVSVLFASRATRTLTTAIIIYNIAVVVVIITVP